ncbi:TonB-dependent vitamin B12 receptor [Denitratisoma sp. agr-D3]
MRLSCKRSVLTTALLSTFAHLALAEDVLPDTVVIATRVPTRANELLSDVTVVGREDIQRAGHQSLPELLSSLPGIQFSRNGGPGSSGSLFIRGSNSSHALVLVDGQRLSSATTGTTAIEHIPVEQIERIEILRGPASSLYGSDAIGGVIQIYTRDPAEKPAPSAALGFGRYGTRTGSLGYGGKIDQTRFNLLAGWETADGFSDIRAAKGGMYDMYNADRDGYANHNVSASLSHQITSTTEVGAKLLSVSADKHFDSVSCDPTGFTLCTPNFDSKQRQELQSFQGYVNHRVNNHWKTSLRLGSSADKTINWQYDPSATTISRAYFNTQQDQMTWQNDFSTTVGTFMAAMEWRNTHVASSQTFAASHQSTRSLVTGYQGRYGAHAVQFSLRSDDIDRIGNHGSGTAAYGYQLNDAWLMRASIGTAFHAPTFNDLYWPLDMVNFFQGNPNLKPERSRNKELGLVYEQGTTTAAATLYRNNVTNLIDFQSCSPFPCVSTNANLGSATLKGASFQYGQRLTSWQWKTGVDFLSARDDSTGRTLQRRAARSANLDVRYLGDTYDLGAQIQAVGNRFINNANSQTLGGYALLNLTANYRLERDWTLQARLDNALDAQYVAVRSSASPFNDYGVAGRSLFLGFRYVPH